MKVMTIHQAKGLEFDTVFVPGLARDCSPTRGSSTTRPSAASRWTSSCAATRHPAVVRRRLAHFKQALQAQELIEERRTALRRPDPGAHAACSSPARTGTGRT